MVPRPALALAGLLLSACSGGGCDRPTPGPTADDTETVPSPRATGDAEERDDPEGDDVSGDPAPSADDAPDESGRDADRPLTLPDGRQLTGAVQKKLCCSEIGACSDTCARGCDGVGKVSCMSKCSKKCKSRGCSSAQSVYGKLHGCIAKKCALKCKDGPTKKCKACIKDKCSSQNASCLANDC